MKLRHVVLVGALSLGWALALGANAPVRAAGQAEALDLGDGYQYELIGAGETVARVANPKTIYINVALKDERIHADHKKLIEASDRLFEAVLMGAAEKAYFKRAIVNIRRPAATTFEDFLYLRGDNDVWVRQAGTESWKSAQDTKYTPPKSEKIEFAGLGTFAVETASEIPAPAGFRRAAEIDFVTATPVIDIQRKYKEIKALWGRIDREKMRADGFDVVLLGNFAEPQRGRFHARKGFFVRIPRDINGPWPELPDRTPDDRDVLISKNEASSDEVTNGIRQVFLSGMGTMRLSDVAVSAAPNASMTITNVSFGAPIPTMKINPNAFLIRLP